MCDVHLFNVYPSEMTHKDDVIYDLFEILIGVILNEDNLYTSRSLLFEFFILL